MERRDKLKKPLWLIPVSGAILFITGMALTSPQAAGVTLIIIGAMTFAIGIGIWSGSVS
jgi:hypothetical protein